MALIVFTLTLAAPIASARAETPVCPSYVDPQITVQPTYTTPFYDSTKSVQEIQVMSGQPDIAYAGLHNLPVGLTSSNLRLDSAFEVSTRTTSQDPTACAQISRFNLNFGFSDTTVYLARELLPHSCGYETVLEHESRHVMVDQQILAAYLPQLPPLLAAKLRQTGVVHAVSTEVAIEHLNNVMRNYLRDLGAVIARVRERQQQQIDTLEEYKRISRSCNGEIARMLGNEPLPPDDQLPAIIQ